MEFSQAYAGEYRAYSGGIALVASILPRNAQRVVTTVSPSVYNKPDTLADRTISLIGEASPLLPRADTRCP